MFKVTLEHKIDGVVVATKSCDVQVDTEEEAKTIAVEIASSCQGGMFNTLKRGKHLLTVVSCVKLEDDS